MQRSLDLSPVVAGLLGVLLLIRGGVALSLRPRRRAVAEGRLRQPSSLREGLLDWLDSGLLFIGLMFLLVRPFIAQLVAVDSRAMAPTLHGSRTPQIDGPGDRLLVSKYLRAWRPPQRGDVIAYRAEPGHGWEPARLEVRRLLAVAGDQVEIDREGRLRINGEAVDEPYLEGALRLPLPLQTIPPGYLFVLGDNVAEARGDPAALGGLVAGEHLLGKAVAVCWPPDRWRLLP